MAAVRCRPREAQAVVERLADGCLALVFGALSKTDLLVFDAPVADIPAGLEADVRPARPEGPLPTHCGH